MNTQRDPIYENEIISTVTGIFSHLEKKSQQSEYDLDDFYAMERMLQILIESMIGLARYVLKAQFHSIYSKSGEAFEELYKRNVLNDEDLKLTKKMVGYRNILVHDYLKVNPAITKQLVKNRDFLAIQAIQKKMLQQLK